jgi:hypothetical protein
MTDKKTGDGTAELQSHSGQTTEIRDRSLRDQFLVFGYSFFVNMTHPESTMCDPPSVFISDF